MKLLPPTPLFRSIAWIAGLWLGEMAGWMMMRRR